MKVADVMSKQVEFIKADARLEEVALLIFGRNINGVPVCRGRKIVGFISERDILSQFYPSMQEYVEDPTHSRDFEGMEEKVHEIFSLPAEKIMSQNPTMVSADTPLLRALSMMFIAKVGRLPVADKRGNLIGIISKGDIFRALVGDRLLFTENQDYNDWLSKTYYASVDIKNRLEHEIPDLLKVFQKNKVKTLIDIGCGTGDHIIELARKGFATVGIDRSSEMIKEAERRKEILSEEAKKRVRFYQGEPEDILPQLNKTFDVTLFMGNTISHNPYRYQKVIKITSNYLSERGIIIFQITNFEKVIKAKKRLLSFNFAKLKDEPNKEYAFLEFYDEPNKKDKTILKTFTILTSDGGKRWKWSGVRNSLMAYTTKEDIRRVLRENGLSKISFYGSFFDGRRWDYLFRKPFKPLESDWLIVLAQK